MAAMPILLAIGSQGSDTGPLWSSCLYFKQSNFSHTEEGVAVAINLGKLQKSITKKFELCKLVMSKKKFC